MQDHSLEQVREHLQTVAAHPAQNGWIGRRRTAADTGDAGAPLFYVETYRPSRLIPAHELPEQPGDLGMHLLIAPPGETPVHGVTGRCDARCGRLLPRRPGCRRHGGTGRAASGRRAGCSQHRDPREERGRRIPGAARDRPGGRRTHQAGSAQRVHPGGLRRQPAGPGVVRRAAPRTPTSHAARPLARTATWSPRPCRSSLTNA